VSVCDCKKEEFEADFDGFYSDQGGETESDLPPVLPISSGQEPFTSARQDRRRTADDAFQVRISRSFLGGCRSDAMIQLGMVQRDMCNGV